ncbi:hypothetical protein FVF58_46345 [Paraburkholderia panacisoli]|uniref:2-keto-4-pentenoate hydratase n=1 Tax=Paraburkholderia panacisoli TaxID=2603818 RepID=A0A5B0G3L6_9BURK|nr:hypothetical protein [Paraburkholderia panacisoli]KAA0998034.1 hypothetical protein FVF58_46345 [Paraburkholderia panacisoli]
MKSMSYDPTAAATHLEWASRTGLRIGDLPPGARPGSLEEGYAAQAIFVKQMNEPVVGWKIAGASPRGLRGDLPTAPAHGCLTPSRVIASGGLLKFPSNAKATLETEVAFRFSRSVSPAEEAFEVSSMIDHAFIAIEVVCSRFIDRKAVGQPSFIADNLGFHALICGERVDPFDPRKFEGDAGVWQNGERIAISLSGDDRTRPFDSLKFLWGELARQRKTILEGAIVTTGTLSAPVDVETNGSFRAQISGAKVDVTFLRSDEGEVHSETVQSTCASTSDWMDTGTPFKQAEY